MSKNPHAITRNDRKRLDSELSVYTDPNNADVPPDIALDPHNPANDKFFQTMQRVNRELVATATAMRPKHAGILREVHRGVRNKDIAERMSISQGMVSTVIRSSNGQKFLSLLRYRQALTDGPSTELRQNILWRIAARNEESAPRITLTAVDLLNKMANSYGEEAQTSGIPSINIVVSSPALQKTQLDIAPATTADGITYEHTPDTK